MNLMIHYSKTQFGTGSLPLILNHGILSKASERSEQAFGMGLPRGWESRASTLMDPKMAAPGTWGLLWVCSGHVRDGPRQRSLRNNFLKKLKNKKVDILGNPVSFEMGIAAVTEAAPFVTATANLCPFV